MSYFKFVHQFVKENFTVTVVLFYVTDIVFNLRVLVLIKEPFTFTGRLWLVDLELHRTFSDT